MASNRLIDETTDNFDVVVAPNLTAFQHKLEMIDVSEWRVLNVVYVPGSFMAFLQRKDT
jgi:hypothetical protein